MFSVPKTSRRTKPFVDHVLTFSLLDNKIWFRTFQIVEKDPMVPNGPPQTSLVEVGPRFVMNPIRVFEGSFSGATVYENAGPSLPRPGPPPSPSLSLAPRPHLALPPPPRLLTHAFPPVPGTTRRQSSSRLPPSG